MKRLFALVLAIISILTILLCGCIENETIDQDSNSNLSDMINNTNKINLNETKNLQENITIPFEIIEMGMFGKEKSRRFIHYIKNNKTVIEVYLGEKPNTGYSISITKIIKHNDKLIVYVNESYREGVHAMVITSPYEIVEVNGTYDNVVFELIGKDE
ncbi:protease complex subunit PrcB family protein [Methanotorris igneus]|uniref:PrcB C-terminal domain-containing protein n=1 Tax=Methanotorris igneus (strain DSM 5666 / JCM 11834 / Kol 5) TaxID=880724 RepID=F6BE34_METIK|nr:protease complex subunit PrcB family protein [Methanotorris igneus]AEF95570.1 hypothetical protein Metig_0008 [Methanotorris igneus Kol 5]